MTRKELQLKLQELKAACLAAAEYHPSIRGQILDLYYEAEDAAAAGDELFECMLASDALDDLISSTELDEIVATEDYLNAAGIDDDEHHYE